MGKQTLTVVIFVALGGFLLLKPLQGADAPTPIAPAIPAPPFELEHRVSDPKRPVRPNRQKYKGPIIDTLLHVFPPQEADVDDKILAEIVKGIHRAGVELAVFSSTPNDARLSGFASLAALRNRLVEMGGGAVQSYCGAGYLSNWLHRAYRDGYSEAELERILQRLSVDLDSGLYIGVGELGLYHFDKTGRQYLIEFPPNFAPFIGIVDLIARKQAWLHLHAEPVHPKGKSYEREVFGGLELLLGRNPNLKLILSHTGMTSPANARQLLNRYPALMMNIKIVNEQEHWQHLEPITNGQRELYEDWARLLEEMPKRFVIGTDMKFFRRGAFTQEYTKLIKRFRNILGTLNQKAARMIAFENARHMFGDAQYHKQHAQN